MFDYRAVENGYISDLNRKKQGFSTFFTFLTLFGKIIFSVVLVHLRRRFENLGLCMVDVDGQDTKKSVNVAVFTRWSGNCEISFKNERFLAIFVLFYGVFWGVLVCVFVFSVR